MTPEIVIGLIRSILLIAFSSLLAKGTIEARTIDQIAGALGSLVVIAFSVWAKIKAAKKLEAAKAQTPVIVTATAPAATTEPKP